MLGVAASLALAACGDGASTPVSDASTPVPDATVPVSDAAVDVCALASASLRLALDGVQTDADFVLRLRSFTGREFTHAVGEVRATSPFESASTSKWVTAAVILRLVDSGQLELDARPQDYLDFWTSDASSPLSRITLGSLLSFTSGLSESALCSNLGAANFETCVRSNYEANLEAPPEPGSGFYYGSTHLQVAGLMAIEATGQASWQELFAEFQSATELFTDATYDLPSESNPRLAGGMHWTTDEYLEFLDAIAHRRILSEALWDEVLSDQTAESDILYSPALEGTGEDWHYGYGFWLECTSPVYDCTGVTRISSPGAYGAYPFVDFGQEYIGVLGRQGELGTFRAGKAVLDDVSEELADWARCGDDS